MNVLCHPVSAQRIDSPAADLNETRLRRITFSAKWPLQTHAEGGQVEPVLGGKAYFFILTILFTIVFSMKSSNVSFEKCGPASSNSN